MFRHMIIIVIVLIQSIQKDANIKLIIKKELIDKKYNVITDSLSGEVGNNYAGYNSINSKQNFSAGGYYWINSPYISHSITAWGVNDIGNVYDYSYTYKNSRAVAPCFCI